MKRLPFLTIGVFLLLAQACGPENGRRDIRDYYFPLKTLTEGLVYEYAPVAGDSLASLFWHYQSIMQEDSNILTGTYYEYDSIPLQRIREERVSNGMLLEEISLYLRDTLDQQTRIQGAILSGSVFPFSVQENGGIFLYKVRFDFPNAQNYSTTIIKNRQYLGDTTYTLAGKDYPAVQFSVRELIEQGNEADGFAEPELSGLEIYAKGIGLVYFEKGPKGREQIAYQLKNRYPMPQLLEEFRKRIND
ncbi:MAG: hypothetical protein DHS20C18_05870 [Saprospiraceae bacterium]|nr:MAG: hypothetical protein DHS20C18_05870 [Saprospiraceae bacterium]